MTTNLWEIQKTMNGGFWDVNQVVDALSGNNDVGQITAFAPIAVPSALTVAVNTTSGNLTGNYQYAVAFLTGYLQGDPQNPGSGTLHTQGNTGGGTASSVVSPSAQQVNLTNIPIGGTGVVARVLYRTKSGGNSYFFLQQINDNTTTSWPDNVADSSLGSAMPLTNTTGTKFVGDGSGLTKLPIATSSQLGTVKPTEGLIVDADGTLKAPWSVKGLSSVLSPSRQSFTRSTQAGQVNGNQVTSNVLRLEQGRFHKAPFIEESSANALSANQSNIETDTTGFSTTTSTLIVTGATISRDTSTYYQGSSSLKVVITATSGEGVETTGVSASASSKYTASVWVNAPSGQAMQLLMRDYTNSISATPVSFTGTGQWQRVSTTITTGATAVTNLTMAVVTASATAVTFNIDCLQIENKGYMTTWVTGGVTRNEDSLLYTLDKPLASRWSAFVAWIPQQGSNVSPASNDRMLLSFVSSSTNGGFVYYDYAAQVFKFSKYDGTAWVYAQSPTITFNAGDVIRIGVLHDLNLNQISLFLQINNGLVNEYSTSTTTQMIPIQTVYNGCSPTVGSEANGTIECILHELASGETVSTDEVTALFGASDWGLGDYPAQLVKVDASNNPQTEMGQFLAQVLSGGYKIQSGIVNITIATAGTQVSQSVTFPNSFTNTPQVAPVLYAVSSSTATYATAVAGSITTSGFTLAANSGIAQTLSIMWIAIGS